ncbi:hypothetical protein ONE63_008779 [Megalurothrips usitatus]|uniref:Uncharacterized protein n=1 Tax=Megalurothrips usitatus TaxID=439358 RepID=A0AAV7XPP5_9NEOP|nr:hypothetical protein ONE63_008779 [Megalurothrips usitatus]
MQSAQVIPTLARPSPAPFVYPPMIYWPYPSPPVSPTSYYGGGIPANAVAPPGPPMGGPGPIQGPPHPGAPHALVISQPGLPFSVSPNGDMLNLFQGFPEVFGLFGLLLSCMTILTVVDEMWVAVRQTRGQAPC